MKILAIKFAQFGDVVQSLGAFQDISNHYNVKIERCLKTYRLLIKPICVDKNGKATSIPQLIKIINQV